MAEQLTPGECAGPACGPDLSDEQLRGALELAFAVAVAGQRLRPPIPPPPPLKAFLKFQKLPTSALGTVRRVVEADDEFRTRAAGIATTELVGAVGVEWLARADGWRDRLAAALAGDAGPAATADPGVAPPAVDPAERPLAKRLARTEDALIRARADLAAAQADAARERTRRTEAERRAGEANAALESAVAKAERAAEDLTRSRARADDASANAGALIEERRALRDRIAQLEGRLDAALADRLLAETPVQSGRVEDDVSFDEARRALIDASKAVHVMADALERAAKGLPGIVNRAPSSRTSERRIAARTALPIPGGLLGDSAAVALHLMKSPGATVLVDGYNVAKLAWPADELALQRERLCDQLEDLVRRQVVRIVVVFDGAEVFAASTNRRLIRVRFTPPGVRADDEIMAAVAELPGDQPVVVVTNDQEIVRSARANGANVLTSEQFLAAVRR